jgi:hypothetical protein
MCTSNEFIPWTCHVCGKEYGEKEGGLCVRCKQVACDKHLRILLVDDISGEKGKLICERCLEKNEKTGSMLWWKLKNGLFKGETQ